MGSPASRIAKGIERLVVGQSPPQINELGEPATEVEDQRDRVGIQAANIRDPCHGGSSCPYHIDYHRPTHPGDRICRL
jgi:hypothetical protein